MEEIIKRMQANACAEEFKNGGIEAVYEEMLKDKNEAEKINKEEKGENFNKVAFESSYISAKIDMLSLLLQWRNINVEKEDRETIANELIKLAEELKAL